MFHRRNSQKPSDDLISSFKPRFDKRDTIAGTTAPPNANASEAVVFPSDMDFSQFQDQAQSSSDFNASSYALSMDLPATFTPKDSHDDLFGSNMLGMPPTPGPSMMSSRWGIHDFPTHQNDAAVITPASAQSSMPGSLSTANLQQQSFYGQKAFHDPSQSPNPFRTANSFAHTQSFPPHQLMQSNLYNPSSSAYMPMQNIDLKSDPDASTKPLFTQKSLSSPPVPAHIQRELERFRFHVTLKAPTAMLRHEQEIPVTYLNKRQAYTISIVDTKVPADAAASFRYRTSVRVCFDDAQQRKKPASFWQLFKEGRGINEAESRGGKLQAVEFVEPEQGLTPNVKHEISYFDGFCFTWSPGLNGIAECAVQARFNFLSTDFSHSKGVKGVPVRLCAKTEIIGLVGSDTRHRAQDSEICFCKVKAFRDHGAERKLNNDRQHIEKNIEKLKQAIQQVADGTKDVNGKRRRSDSVVGGSRPSKAAKHKRTYSISSGSSNDGRDAAEDDMHVRLQNLENMFNTVRQISYLYLRGEDQDDPDLHPVDFRDQPPVELPTDQVPSLRRQGTQNTSKSSNLSLSPSSRSMQSGRRESIAASTGASPTAHRQGPGNFATMRPPSLHEARFSNPQGLSSPPDGPIKRLSMSRGGDGYDRIDVIGIDPMYQPPPERTDKPIACFFVKPSTTSAPRKDDLYRAVYLRKRTVEDLTQAIALKSGIDRSSIDHVIRITEQGLHVSIDEEVVAEIPEGQDMHADFDEVEDEGFGFFDSDESQDHVRYVLKLRY